MSNQVAILPSKYKNRALFAFLVPFLTMIGVLFLYSILTFIAESGVLNETFVLVMNVLLGLIGTFAMIGTPVGLGFGVYFLGKKEYVSGTKFDERSGKGDQSVVPPEIDRWNWAAAFLGIIWGLYHRVWLSLVCFVPVVGWIWWIVMGIKGNEWAWRANHYESVEAFLQQQRKWQPWGIAVLVICLTFFLVYAGILIALLVGARAVEQL